MGETANIPMSADCMLTVKRKDGTVEKRQVFQDIEIDPELVELLKKLMELLNETKEES